MEPTVYNITEACEAGRTGRTALYAAIRKGELRAVKRGRRTLVLARDLRQWLESLPAIEHGPALADIQTPDQATGDA
jgi:excisionase family DNA binding protein